MLPVVWSAITLKSKKHALEFFKIRALEVHHIG